MARAQNGGAAKRHPQRYVSDDPEIHGPSDASGHLVSTITASGG